MTPAVEAAPRHLSSRDATDEQFVQTYKPPKFMPPFPVKIHPLFLSQTFWVRFTERINQWLLDLEMETFFTPKMYEVLTKMDVCGLPARIYAESSEWGLEWACKFFFMLWVWDDKLGVASSPEAAFSYLLDLHLVLMWSFPDDPVLLARLEHFLIVLDEETRKRKLLQIESVLQRARAQPPGTVYNGELPKVCNIFVDLWADAVTRMPADFTLRLAHITQIWLLGMLAETQTRDGKLPPSIESYIQLRRTTAAVVPTLVIVDIVYDLKTPNDWFYCPEMERVMDALTDIVSWHNDLWSFKREVLQNELFNLVLTVKVHSEVPYKEAVEIVTQMLYARIADFEVAVAELEEVTPPELGSILTTYTDTFRNWVSGTHDWHDKSLRYKELGIVNA